MSAPLRKSELLERVLKAIDLSGWQALLIESTHPFLVRVFKREQSRVLSLRVYIWNCTHGGNNRAADEYRVQLTGVVPEVEPDETTVLLGWHDGYGVFVAFDIQRHKGQDSASPSIQVKEASLLNAHTHAFSAYDRANGEIAVCFRPEYIVEYALNLEPLHEISVADRAEVKMLNAVDTTTDAAIETQIKSAKRRSVIASIARKYREHDFRWRVLSAYGSTCACCGVQLRLIEAAHIIPVASDTSTDETTNGVALCALHHKAYDQNLISFDEKYRIEIGVGAIAELKGQNLDGGLAAFRKHLKEAILLPADKRDHPDPAYIRESRRVRAWES